MAMESEAPPDWEVGPVRYPSAQRVRLYAFLALPAVLLLVAAALAVWGPTGAGVFLAAIGFGGLFALGFGWWRTSKPYKDAVALEDPRFENLVAGLVERIGVEAPNLLLMERGAPNALVWPGSRPSFAVTRSLLDQYTRTEQEAVAAHSLLRIHSGNLRFTRLAALLGSRGSSLAPRVGYEDDVHAAALTRYPPGLADAVRKAVPVEGPAAGLWFVADDPSHRPPAERIAQLQSL